MHKRENLIVRLLILVLSVALSTGITSAENIIYVDPNDTGDYLTIQEAIDTAVDGDTVLVAPGTYTGDGNRNIDFKGKAITVKSEDGYKTCIIDCQGSLDEHHCGFHFQNYEDANSIIQGFTITHGYGSGGITCYRASPLIVDCLITDNTALQSGGGIRCLGSNSIIIRCHIRNNNAELLGGGIFITLSGNTISQPTLINCIITGNNSKYGGGLSCSSNNVVLVNCTISGNQASLGGGGVYFSSGHSGKIYNSILYGNVAATGREIAMFYFPGRGGCPEYPFLNITHSIVGSDPNAIAMIHCPDLISGEWLHVDPHFVYPGYWADFNDPNIIAEPNDPNSVWIDGDYHLKSQAGRWDPNTQSWVQDDVTSPCIDAGDPNSPVGDESEPNGGRINMGAYGGTDQASKSYSGGSSETVIAGSIVGWGSNNYGQATPPDGNDFVAIAAGAFNSLAIKSDGSIVSWGSDLSGEPPDGNDFVAIASGWPFIPPMRFVGYGLALKSDGSMVCWDYGSYKTPEGNDFIAIAAGASHSLALKSDGSVVGWGPDFYGETIPPDGNDFVAIAAGSAHSLALKSDGSIVGWGWNYSGQATPPDGNNFVAIAAGFGYSLALKSDGSIVCWGDNQYGQATPPAGNDFIAIAAGSSHSLALRSDGSIVSWPERQWLTPPAGNDFVAIAAGYNHCLAIKKR